MDLSIVFIQYEIDNPHNVAFKSLVSYENREDTIEGFRKLLDGTGGGWILCKDNLPDDGVEVLFKAKLDGRKYVGHKHTHIYHDGEKRIEYHYLTVRGSTRIGLKPIAWMPLPE